MVISSNTAVSSKCGYLSKNTLIILVFLLSVVIPIQSAAAQTARSDIEIKQAGERLLRRHCARCHLVGVNGKSPHPEAPMLKNVSKNYPVELLAESLAEGIFTGHPDMPVFYFTASEVEEIISYLESIQIR